MQPLFPLHWQPLKPSRSLCQGMTCAACPITVKKALTKVDGVSKVGIVFEKREAIVSYDDAKTNIQKLTKATEDAGYPSTVKQ